MIEHPFPSSDAWVSYYSQANLPVLRQTLNTLKRMQANAENISGRVLSSAVLQDPLMTLRVLAYIQEHRSEKQNADITTIGRALIMIGTDPFFRDFENVPMVEEQLAGHPQALLGMLKVISRARRAVIWARDWAIVRHDLDIEEITVATLLRDAAEILMWCFAPTLALKVRALQLEEPRRRSADCQLEIYGVSLKDLKTDLVRAWNLPSLLISLLDPAHADQPRVLNVQLATDLARHAANGWNDPALPDDFRAIENLLRLSHKALIKRLGLEDVESAQLEGLSRNSAGS